MSDLGSTLAFLLGMATLLPLASFFIILCAYPRAGKGFGHSAYISIGAIVGACVLSFISLALWLNKHWPDPVSHGDHGAGHHESGSHDKDGQGHDKDEHGGSEHGEDGHDKGHDDHKGHDNDSGDGANVDSTRSDIQLVSTLKDDESASHGESALGYAGEYYLLGRFGNLKLSIGYYIDTLTVCMFCMVTLIASCIHIYATGYMHEELHDVTDHEVTMKDGSHLTRPGRYFRFFQYLSLFSFSMLGLVLAGNIAMVFVFWELVGICSYFLIGFYIERKSATNAANKAFIVNRVGDFGMIIGLMALWSGLGTFAFGDAEDVIFKLDAAQVAELQEGQLSTEVRNEFRKWGEKLPRDVIVAPGEDGGWVVGIPNSTVSYFIEWHNRDIYKVWRREVGMFSLVRPSSEHHATIVPDGMVRWGAREQVAEIVNGNLASGTDGAQAKSEEEISESVAQWRAQTVDSEGKDKAGCWGYLLLVVGGIGIFCGCVGKSAQFPLHVWLPDAMEGPTPVSALVHSATMVAAGVYLVGRFYPIFVPEVLLVIAVAGCVTLFMAATIAITATDIKRVLAYSTVSQLGYMMMALGVGGWLAGMMHLITHAFFKSLLFLCSGSVIHAVHTNEMPEMGGLLKKMPWTGYTMLIGCLAIAGTPFFSGFYSKDAILEQAYSFGMENGQGLALIFFIAALGSAAITAFYMFRLWFLTFVGDPRNKHRYDHAHESPKAMYLPLVVLSCFAVGVAWTIPYVPSLAQLLEQARPLGTLAVGVGNWLTWIWPDEHLGHAYKLQVTAMALATAVGGIGFAASFYWWRIVDPAETKEKFAAVHRFLINKWWFDELYDFIFVRPTHVISRLISSIDRRVLDGIVDGLACVTRGFSNKFDAVADRTIVDGSVNLFASWMYNLGTALREVQRGKLREYIMFIVLGTIVMFVLVSFL